MLFIIQVRIDEPAKIWRKLSRVKGGFRRGMMSFTAVVYGFNATNIIQRSGTIHNAARM